MKNSRQQNDTKGVVTHHTDRWFCESPFLLRLYRIWAGAYFRSSSGVFPVPIIHWGYRSSNKKRGIHQVFILEFMIPMVNDSESLLKKNNIKNVEETKDED